MSYDRTLGNCFTFNSNRTEFDYQLNDVGQEFGKFI